LSRHLLRLTVATFTGHVPVRGHLYTLGLFDGDPTNRCCWNETETVQHITCCCEALARQRYNVLGNIFVEPKEISTASVKLSRHLLRLTVAIFAGHAPVRGHLYTLGLFDGDPTCRFCGEGDRNSATHYLLLRGTSSSALYCFWESIC
jgi:hypothetical protein